MLTLSHSKSRRWLAVLALALFACAAQVFADPPSRVARLNVVRGDVSVAPAGAEEWYAADLNRPLVSGDKLYTDRAARAELDLGAATARLEGGSSFRVLDLDDQTAQLELTQGSFNLRVHKLYGDQRYEVDTPTLAFVVRQPGEYRIDIGAEGNTTQVTVFDGAGDVYGDDGAQVRVDQRQSYRFDDSRLRDYATLELPRPDDFDNWCFARDERYDGSLSRRYVSDEVVGAADLDEYGAWDDVPSYGPMWFPTRVADDWAPYRDGHWAWVDPWGWTWVDDAPWGFAPSHYGRWVYAGSRWGWLPGPPAVRPVYAPALVIFIGGDRWSGGHARGDAPVGWCPLGPRDVYRPPYRVSRNYFTHVNAGNTPLLDRDRINGDYDDYAHGRPLRDHDYAYRHNPAAVTAVSRATFVQARPVARGRLRLQNQQLTQTQIVRDNLPPPTAASQAPTAQVRTAVPRAGFQRKVIARHAPPSTVSTNARVRVIERNGGQPLTNPQPHLPGNAPATAAPDHQRPGERVPGRTPARELQPLPVMITNEPQFKSHTAPAAPQDHRPPPAAARPTESETRQAPAVLQRENRPSSEQRGAPAIHVVPPRRERNAGPPVIEHAAPMPQLPVHGPVNPRTEERAAPRGERQPIPRNTPQAPAAPLRHGEYRPAPHLQPHPPAAQARQQRAERNAVKREMEEKRQEQNAPDH